MISISKGLFILFSFNFFCINGYEFLDITKFGYEQYQDIIINNKVVKEATKKYRKRDCKSRYEIIKTILDKYERPFTFLDIGASQGYYSFRTAHDYDCVCVMIEGDNKHYPLIGKQLLDLCKCNTDLDNIIFLQKKIAIEDLKRLSECEHFDVILLLNIAHWFGSRWKELLEHVFAMGDNIIVEVPPQEPKIVNNKNNKLRKKIEDYLVSNNAKIIGKAKRHTSNKMSNIYLVENKDHYLKRKTWLMPFMNDKRHIIKSDFKEKFLFKELEFFPGKIIKSNWVSGINLITFKMYNGVYPSKKDIKSSIYDLRNVYSNDWNPNNMIVKGKKIAFIDTNDPDHNPGVGGGYAPFSKKKFNNILKFIDVDGPKKVENFFWKVVIGSKNFVSTLNKG